MISKLFKFLLKYIPRPWLIRLSYPAKAVLPLLLRGNRYIDPIDGKGYRKFLPYGYGDRQRPNVLAPGSLSLERHRLLWLYLKRHTDFFTAEKSMLHVAPEQCFYKRFRNMKNLNYVTADIESPLADLKFDLHDIPLPDNTYDVIFCHHVLEHVDDDIRCMQELRRVLKPGGMAIMQVPQDINRAETFSDSSITDVQERIRLFGQYDHVRVYGLDYPQRLESAGFKVDTYFFEKDLSQEDIDRYRLMPGERLYTCTK
ncbi:MAG: methyltransferase domain-containing protein [Cryomorphaceae bacterium]|nr:methyltransferase domain-containing protein [Cryomorphaceae bacterium]